MSGTGFAPVLTTPELGPGAMVEVEAGGRSLIVLNVAQTYYVLDGTCTGCGAALGRTGELRGDVVVCGRDGARFDVQSGARVDGSGDPLRRYALRIAGNEISIGPPLGD